ncbi:hypothetical protein [Chelativorans sp. AA-79]|uniref:hypothetical protein n=1 Tax=Chelativorans sp. AA-79 TaxID=3028735 RepID=UPI0023F91515|nr:hypothetical protein [Chelativorans sp. AA-79]WEX08266.1 hypothetical protein PVE73_19620 [Chelativorans sp. AA-79]
MSSFLYLVSIYFYRTYFVADALILRKAAPWIHFLVEISHSLSNIALYLASGDQGVRQMNDGKERLASWNEPASACARDLLVLHLREAFRLGAEIGDEIDFRLLKHLLAMSIEVAREGDARLEGRGTLHS